jgi:NAD(P)-dependent dehydrogenase (short-subunit alcohol dehydrogenase family)
MAEAGADVALGARRIEKLTATGSRKEQFGRRSVAVKTGVTVPEDCQALASKAIGAFGKMDVDCAGRGTATPASRETPEEFRRVFETNLVGSYWTTQACAKFMGPGAK